MQDAPAVQERHAPGNVEEEGRLQRVLERLARGVQVVPQRTPAGELNHQAQVRSDGRSRVQLDHVGEAKIGVDANLLPQGADVVAIEATGQELLHGHVHTVPLCSAHFAEPPQPERSAFLEVQVFVNVDLERLR